MLPILTLAAAITFGTPHRVAPFHTGVAPYMNTHLAGVVAEGNGFRVYWQQRNDSAKAAQLMAAHVSAGGHVDLPALPTWCASTPSHVALELIESHEGPR